MELYGLGLLMNGGSILTGARRPGVGSIKLQELIQKKIMVGIKTIKPGKNR